MQKPEKEIRAKTKGRFQDIHVNGPAENFERDKRWLNKANPLAGTAYSKYLARDRELLEKRRFQRILKEIQLEEAAGIKVTKMPKEFLKK